MVEVETEIVDDILYVKRLRDMAGMLGVSERTASRFIKQGMPGKTQHGYNSPACIRWYLGHRVLEGKF